MAKLSSFARQALEKAKEVQRRQGSRMPSGRRGGRRETPRRNVSGDMIRRWVQNQVQGRGSQTNVGPAWYNPVKNTITSRVGGMPVYYDPRNVQATLKDTGVRLIFPANNNVPLGNVAREYEQMRAQRQPVKLPVFFDLRKRVLTVEQTPYPLNYDSEKGEPTFEDTGQPLNWSGDIPFGRKLRENLSRKFAFTTPVNAAKGSRGYLEVDENQNMVITDNPTPFPVYLDASTGSPTLYPTGVPYVAGGETGFSKAVSERMMESYLNTYHVRPHTGGTAPVPDQIFFNLDEGSFGLTQTRYPLFVGKDGKPSFVDTGVPYVLGQDSPEEISDFADRLAENFMGVYGNDPVALTELQVIGRREPFPADPKATVDERALRIKQYGAFPGGGSPDILAPFKEGINAFDGEPIYLSGYTGVGATKANMTVLEKIGNWFETLNVGNIPFSNAFSKNFLPWIDYVDTTSNLLWLGITTGGRYIKTAQNWVEKTFQPDKLAARHTAMADLNAATSQEEINQIFGTLAQTTPIKSYKTPRGEVMEELGISVADMMINQIANIERIIPVDVDTWRYIQPSEVQKNKDAGNNIVFMDKGEYFAEKAEMHLETLSLVQQLLWSDITGNPIPEDVDKAPRRVLPLIPLKFPEDKTIMEAIGDLPHGDMRLKRGELLEIAQGIRGIAPFINDESTKAYNDVLEEMGLTWEDVEANVSSWRGIGSPRAIALIALEKWASERWEEETQPLYIEGLTALDAGDFAGATKILGDAIRSDWGGSRGLYSPFHSMTIDMDSDRRERYLNDLVLATMQAGRPLTDNEVWLVKRVHEDPWEEAFMEATTEVIFIVPDFMVGLLFRGAFKTLGVIPKAARVPGKVITKTADILVDIPIVNKFGSTKVGKLLGRLWNKPPVIHQVFSTVSWAKKESWRTIRLNMRDVSKNLAFELSGRVLDQPDDLPNIFKEIAEAASKARNQEELLELIGESETVSRLATIAPSTHDLARRLFGRLQLESRRVEIERVKGIRPAGSFNPLRIWEPDRIGRTINQIMDDVAEAARKSAIDQTRALGYSEEIIARSGADAAKLAINNPDMIAEGFAKKIYQSLTSAAYPIPDISLAYDKVLFHILTGLGLHESKAIKGGLTAFMSLGDWIKNMWIFQVLSGRPAWLTRNLFDSQVRYMLGGGALLDDLGAVTELTTRRLFGHKRASNAVVEAFSHALPTGNPTLVQRILKGEFARSGRVRLLGGIIRSTFDEQYALIRESLRVAGVKGGPRAFWEYAKATTRALLLPYLDAGNTIKELNSLAEFSWRVRLLHKEASKLFKTSEKAVEKTLLGIATETGLPDDLAKELLRVYKASYDEPEKLLRILNDVRAGKTEHTLIGTDILAGRVERMVHHLEPHEQDIILETLKAFYEDNVLTAFARHEKVDARLIRSWQKTIIDALDDAADTQSHMPTQILHGVQDVEGEMADILQRLYGDESIGSITEVGDPEIFLPHRPIKRPEPGITVPTPGEIEQISVRLKLGKYQKGVDFVNDWADVAEFSGIGVKRVELPDGTIWRIVDIDQKWKVLQIDPTNLAKLKSVKKIKRELLEAIGNWVELTDAKAISDVKIFDNFQKDWISFLYNPGKLRRVAPKKFVFFVEEIGRIDGLYDSLSHTTDLGFVKLQRMITGADDIKAIFNLSASEADDVIRRAGEVGSYIPEPTRQASRILRQTRAAMGDQIKQLILNERNLEASYLQSVQLLMARMLGDMYGGRLGKFFRERVPGPMAKVGGLRADMWEEFFWLGEQVSRTYSKIMKSALDETVAGLPGEARVTFTIQGILDDMKIRTFYNPDGSLRKVLIPRRGGSKFIITDDVTLREFFGILFGDVPGLGDNMINAKKLMNMQWEDLHEVVHGRRPIPDAVGDTVYKETMMDWKLYWKRAFRRIAPGVPGNAVDATVDVLEVLFENVMKLSGLTPDQFWSKYPIEFHRTHYPAQVEQGFYDHIIRGLDHYGINKGPFYTSLLTQRTNLTPEFFMKERSTLANWYRISTGQMGEYNSRRYWFANLMKAVVDPKKWEEAGDFIEWVDRTQGANTMVFAPFWRWKPTMGGRALGHLDILGTILSPEDAVSEFLDILQYGHSADTFNTRYIQNVLERLGYRNRLGVFFGAVPGADLDVITIYDLAKLADLIHKNPSYETLQVALQKVEGLINVPGSPRITSWTTKRAIANILGIDPEYLTAIIGRGKGKRTLADYLFDVDNMDHTELFEFVDKEIMRIKTTLTNMYHRELLTTALDDLDQWHLNRVEYPLAPGAADADADRALALMKLRVAKQAEKHGASAGDHYIAAFAQQLTHPPSAMAWYTGTRELLGKVSAAVGVEQEPNALLHEMIHALHDTCAALAKEGIPSMDAIMRDLALLEEVLRFNLEGFLEKIDALPVQSMYFHTLPELLTIATETMVKEDLFKLHKFRMAMSRLRPLLVEATNQAEMMELLPETFGRLQGRSIMESVADMFVLAEDDPTIALKARFGFQTNLETHPSRWLVLDDAGDIEDLGLKWRELTEGEQAMVELIRPEVERDAILRPRVYRKLLGGLGELMSEDPEFAVTTRIYLAHFEHELSRAIANTVENMGVADDALNELKPFAEVFLGLGERRREILKPSYWYDVLDVIKSIWRGEPWDIGREKAFLRVKLVDMMEEGVTINGVRLPANPRLLEILKYDPELIKWEEEGWDALIQHKGTRGVVGAKLEGTFRDHLQELISQQQSRAVLDAEQKLWEAFISQPLYGDTTLIRLFGEKALDPLVLIKTLDDYIDDLVRKGDTIDPGYLGAIRYIRSMIANWDFIKQNFGKGIGIPFDVINPQALPVPWPVWRQPFAWQTWLGSNIHLAARRQMLVDVTNEVTENLIEAARKGEIGRFIVPTEHAEGVQKWLRDAYGTKTDNLNFAFGGGENIPGIGVDEGAIKRVGDVMLDYSQTSVFDEAMKSIFPFWMFPSRSLVFWTKMMQYHPEILVWYTKFMSASQKDLRQQGLVTTSGEPMPSLVGKIRIPGTQIWLDPTQVFSFRFMLPRPWLIDRLSGRYEEENGLTLSKAINRVMILGEWLGFNTLPWVRGPMEAFTGAETGYEDFTLFPVLELISPQWMEKNVRSKLRRTFLRSLADMPFWAPEYKFMDSLIEQRMLAHALDGIRATDDPFEKQRIAQQVKEALGYRAKYDYNGEYIGFETDINRTHPRWQQAYQEVHSSQYNLSLAGFFTGFYAREYSDAEARFYDLRHELNLLRDAINNEILQEAFMPKDLGPSELYDMYTEKRYNTAEGEIYDVRGMLSFVRAPQGELVTDPTERRERIVEILDRREREAAYWDGIEALSAKLQNDLASIPIGDDEARRAIYNVFFQRRAAIDENPMFIEARRSWTFGYKPMQRIEQHFVDLAFQMYREAKPVRAEGEDYQVYRLRLALWERDFDALKPQIIEAVRYSLVETANGYEMNENGDITLPGDRMVNVEDIISHVGNEMSYDNYVKWRRSRATVLDAVESAYDENYVSAYWDYVQDSSNKFDRELKSREFLEKGPPRDEEIIQWVMEMYPGQFTEQQIRNSLKGRDIYGMDDKLMPKNATDKQIQNVWDWLMWAGPSSSKLREAFEEMGGRDSDIDVWYATNGNPEAWASELAFQRFYMTLENAVGRLGLKKPSETELAEWSAARDLNDKFYLTTEQVFGSDIQSTMAQYYNIDDDEEKKEFRKAHPEVDAYRVMRDAYAVAHPEWAKYFNERAYKEIVAGETPYWLKQEAKGFGTSGGGYRSGARYYRGGGAGGGYYGGSRASTATESDRFVPMGYRATLHPAWLRPSIVGRGGAGGRPYISTKVRKTVGPTAVKEIDDLVEESKPLSEALVKYLKRLKERFPEEVELIDSLLASDTEIKKIRLGEKK